MKRKRISFVIAAVLIGACAGIYFYYGFLFKEARSIESELPDISITAAKLHKDYQSNLEQADSLYLNKTIEITGLVTKETDSAMTLENTVFCLFTKRLKDRHINNKVTVKGKCIGYDELFEEVKFDQCIINKSNN